LEIKVANARKAEKYAKKNNFNQLANINRLFGAFGPNPSQMLMGGNMVMQPQNFNAPFFPMNPQQNFMPQGPNFFNMKPGVMPPLNFQKNKLPNQAP
jgi:hypothetical protein